MRDIREASLEPGAERLPGGAAGQAGPFAVLAAGALWLYAIWDQLPARLPVHWNWRGEVDRMVDRSFWGASLPLLIGAALCLAQLAIQLGIRHGAPRAPLRASMMKLVLAGEYFVALVCCGVLASTATAGRFLAQGLAACFLGAFALLAYTWKLAHGAPRPPARNPAAWHGGLIYIDRDDPALFVPKRSGTGYTFNFGNPLALVMTLAILALPLLAVLFALSAR